MVKSDSGNEAKALGERVAKERNQLGLSVAKLAELAGVSKAYVHQIENGDCQRPSAHVLFSIATTLGTSIAYLLGKSSSSPEPDTIHIPESLQRFASDVDELTPDDIKMLARIKHRDHQPDNVEDWRYLWESIKRSIRSEDT